MRTARTLRMTIALMGLLAAVAPAWGQSYRGRSGVADRDGAFRLWLGAFRPDGNSEYWDDVERDFTGDIGDFENASFGADYLLNLSRNTGLLFSGSVFEGDTTQSYRGFLDNFGDRIRHDTTLGIASATLGVVFHFAPGATISPYLGVGGGAYFWTLEEEGDFIDFGPPDEIFSARLESDGVAFGHYWLAGLEAPISDRLSIFAEGRWTRAKDELSGDFESFGGEIDLSGRQYAVGLSWNM